MSKYSNIEKFIQEDLRKSGLTLKDFPVTPLLGEDELLNRLGFKFVGEKRIIDIGGYWIEFPNEPGYYRLKLMKEVKDEEGHKIKYLSPSSKTGKGNHAYIPAGVERLLKRHNPGEVIGLVEGEKKAQAATDAGVSTIGLSGIWNLNDSDNDFLPELEKCNWKDKAIKITYDSDMTSKPEVKQAELRAAVKFTNRGAKVFSVRLPNQSDGTKNGADDYIVRYGKAKYNELNQQARPTIELLISENMDIEKFLREIARLESKIEQERIILLLHSHTKIPVSAFREELAKHTPRTAEGPEPIEKNYSGYFPGLVDLVEDDKGRVAFLVKEGEELEVRSNAVVDGQTYYPPEMDANIRKILRCLPRAAESIRHYKADSDLAIYNDLLAYHAEVSELPDERLYELVAAWVIHTYLMENFSYSPYIWLYAIPEKGKTRTGKGAINVACRGMHIESLRDAHLIRFASDWKATLFIDVMDLWAKSEKAGSEDFLLQRHEKGAMVARVLYPERGPFKDTVWYDIFGPTFIATNEGIHPALESRAILITMREADRTFDEISPDTARNLKERLVGFRARHLGKPLEEVEKPAKGRLGDILKPLLQVIRLVAPEREEDFIELISDLDTARRAQKSESTEAKLVAVVSRLENAVEAGFLKNQKILDEYNEGVNERYKISDRSLGWKLAALGFIKDKFRGERGIKYDTNLIGKLMVSFGLSDPLPTEKKRPKRPKRPKSNNDDNLDVDVLLDSSSKTSTKRPDVSAHNHSTKDNLDIMDVFPKGKAGVRENEEEEHSEACDCEKCCPTPKRNANGRRPSNSISKTIAIKRKIVRLDYDKGAGTITVEREGKKKVLFNYEAEYEEYFQLGGFRN